ncbi:MAG: thiamine phosphate synthase [Wenyingzhuangia sp.]|jgi:thiamine-phosphate pyrophosphorylase|uniref:thiamine phosphate synthase n=1 Tax=Wenyingzhuangia sp. TaxID=1964193 RepID=UPI0032199BB7
MLIPKLHYISQGISPKDHLENIQNACQSGAELIQLNFKSISDKKALKIATEARKITHHFQTRLILNNQPKIAKEIKADGVYLGDNNHTVTEVRKHLHSWQLIGASANTLQECKILINKHVDYIGLGEFKQTKTDNETNSALNKEAYQLIVEELDTKTPIIAYGDITKTNIADLLESGVSGIAMSNEITKNFNLIRTLNRLLKAGNSEEQKYNF